MVLLAASCGVHAAPLAPDVEVLSLLLDAETAVELEELPSDEEAPADEEEGPACDVATPPEELLVEGGSSAGQDVNVAVKASLVSAMAAAFWNTWLGSWTSGSHGCGAALLLDTTPEDAPDDGTALEDSVAPLDVEAEEDEPPLDELEEVLPLEPDGLGHPHQKNTPHRASVVA